MSAERKETASAAPYALPPGSRWRHAWKFSLALGLLGLIASLIGAVIEPHRFAFSWLFAFMTFLAVALGGLFFVLGQHLTGAGWGVTVRRSAELLMVPLPLFALLFVPIALSLHALYPWMEVDLHEPPHHEAGEHALLGDGRAHAQDARELHDVRPSEWPAAIEVPGSAAEHETPQAREHEHLLAEKRGYFHLGGRAVFFLLRAVLYFAAWSLLAFFFGRWSRRQDRERGVALTHRMQRLAPPATIVFGLTLTFAAFDWMMSMEPLWYSTIFGVQYFSTCAVIGHVAVVFLTLAARRAGRLEDAITVEHYHDLGKLIFGFLVFWAYISFSQFMLIWYAGIPEEATYYHLRWWGGSGYQGVSVFLVLAGFVLPFFLLVSRHTKRRLRFLVLASAWLVVVHVVQMYWLVAPYEAQEGLIRTALRVSWLDLTALLAVGGLYLAVVLWQLTRLPLIPVGDPRLSRALHFENV
jgi:hypothetical protein